jgi:hypothetical protein
MNTENIYLNMKTKSKLFSKMNHHLITAIFFVMHSMRGFLSAEWGEEENHLTSKITRFDVPQLSPEGLCQKCCVWVDWASSQLI